MAAANSADLDSLRVALLEEGSWDAIQNDLQLPPRRKFSCSCCAGFGQRIMSACGIRSREELDKVQLFIVATFLANTFFVIGRNVGTVIFMHQGPGAKYLTTVMVASGVITVFAGQCLSSMSRGVLSTRVYHHLLVVGSLLFSLLYAAAVLAPSTALRSVAATAIFVTEDLFTLFICMQQSTVAQSAFSVGEAKRLFGLVQLGNSIAAMSVGMTIGRLASCLGTVQLLLLQVAVMLLSILPNTRIARKYIEQISVGGKKKKLMDAGGEKKPQDVGPWWTNLLVLAMAFWAFTVIFAKTMYEFEYNILVAQTVSESGMVALTGYLYAAAGVASSVINLFGTNAFISMFGIKGAILSTPLFLLLSSSFILACPGVWSTFVGRCVDLSLRWSINNTVRSVLWMAVPVQQAVSAKPWVEGTIKKLGSTVTALVISLVLGLGQGRIDLLSWVSLAVTGLLMVCCCGVYSLYMESMWQRIKRRELRLSAVPFMAHAGSKGRQVEEDSSISHQVLHRLLHGGAAEQLYILREIGEILSDHDWAAFFSHFHELPTAVQVKAIELGRKQRFRIDDDFLIRLTAEPVTKPAVRTVAILAVGERGLHRGLEYLEILLSNEEPTVRAAAATAILAMGWGLGLGHISSAAQDVLEHMLGFSLAGARARHHGWTSKSRVTCLRRASSSRSMVVAPEPQALCGVEASEDPGALSERAAALRKEWQARIKAGDAVHALAIAIQLTYVEVALQAGKQRPRSRTSSAGELLDSEASPVDTPGGDLSVRTARSRATTSRFHLQKSEKSEKSERERTETSEHEISKTAIALEMIQLLPSARDLIPVDSWFELLRHPFHKVRIAALHFVQGDDAGCTQFKEELQAVVRSLCTPDTYNAAESALRRLGMPGRVQAEVFEQLKKAVDEHKRGNSRPSQAPASDALSDTSGEERSGSKMGANQAATIQAMNLFKYLQRQRIWCTEADMQQVVQSRICDDLLMLGGEISDTDLSQQLLETVVELKARGFAITRDFAEKRALEMAVMVFKSLAAQQHMLELTDSFRTSLAVVDVQLLGSNGSAKDEKGDQPGLVLQLILRYIDEQTYLQKLQLLLLSVLATPCSGVSTKLKTVLAAWRLLRSKDSSSQAAVLEVLASMLPPSLKSLVLSALGDAPLNEKMAVGASLCEELRSPSGPRSFPPWLQDWFASTAHRLGEELGVLARSMAVSGSIELPDPAPGDSNVCLAGKLVLLAPVRLYRDLLATHVAAIAAIASVEQVPKGKQLCHPGETYIVISGSLKAVPSGRMYARGDVIQELHALCRELRVHKAVVKSETATVLKIREDDLFELMFRSPPKFALSILKSLVRVLPRPTQTGGSRAPRAAVQQASTNGAQGDIKEVIEEGAKEEDSADEKKPTRQVSKAESTGDLAILARAHEQPELLSTEAMLEGVEEVEEEEDERSDATTEETKTLGGEEGVMHTSSRNVASKGGGQPPFSMLEKLVLLQGVKIFRYVTLEYLPSIASCCSPRFVAAGASLFEEGEATDATLYIVAEGIVALYSAAGAPNPRAKHPKKRQLLRQLSPGDSIGNTGLLLDDHWHYSANVLEDCWLLCISRSDLTDLLRGRRELASDVIRGLYKTFTRRMQQVASLDARPRERLLTVDCSSVNSPNLKPRPDPQFGMPCTLDFSPTATCRSSDLFPSSKYQATSWDALNSP